MVGYETQSAINIEQLIIEHTDLVKKIAYHLIARLPAQISVDDLIQAGVIGLIEAARNYRSDQGATFETFAGIRIRGAMLDEVRRNDWQPRSSRQKARLLNEAVKKIEGRLGRAAHPNEIATEMNISLDEYYRLAAFTTSWQIFSLDDRDTVGSRDDDSDIDNTSADYQEPYQALENEDFRNALAKVIAHLPEREKLILSLYYDEELNLKEIGEVLEVSESRVSQLLSQALVRVRARMRYWI